MEWSTPQAVWDQKENLWTFPQGVTVSGDVYGFDGRTGSGKKISRKSMLKTGVYEVETVKIRLNI